MEKIDVSILVPTFNCLKLLKSSENELVSCSKIVKELVVVDSQSTDGTLEYLREKFGDSIRIFDHAKGLYQSWNYGISQLSGTFTYIATAGDCVDQEGLRQLYAAAREFRSDIVISPPDMVDSDGVKLSVDWPIHRFLNAVPFGATRPLSSDLLLLCGLAFFPGTLIGSSASNLYRTSCLQAEPFPLDYGREGDSAWALTTGSNLSWAIHPDALSRFVVHGKGERKHFKSPSRVKFLAHYSDLLLNRMDPKERTSEAHSLARVLLDRLLELEQYRLQRDELKQGIGVRSGMLGRYVLNRKLSKLKQSIKLLQDELVEAITAKIII
jgi:glycosyltransferase involved in cell wall biosynthesis